MLISTHAPLARRDINCRWLCATQFKFLLTRLSRGATTSPGKLLTEWNDFYSRASREARRSKALNVHARIKFLLTRLSRGATNNHPFWIVNSRISTHAPLARRDSTEGGLYYVLSNFYSRASREARHNIRRKIGSEHNFYSRASREARRLAGQAHRLYGCDFYSRASREARPDSSIFDAEIKYFYSRASREARQESEWYADDIRNFYSRASREARPIHQSIARGGGKFLLTRLSRGATKSPLIFFFNLRFLLTRLSRGATINLLK